MNASSSQIPLPVRESKMSNPMVISLPADQRPLEPLFTMEPMTPLRTQALQTEYDEDSDLQNYQYSNSIDFRRDKKKRGRVSDDQLLLLERIFARDRNPPPSKRREIGHMLGMNERQTQVWFQNRRAKAKSVEIRQREIMYSSKSILPVPETPPKLSRGFEIELHNLLHEKDSILIIPISELSVGRWRRIASATMKHDLIAYGCEARQSITWFIHSGGHSYKMEIFIETILDAASDNSRLTLLLSRPPRFYLESEGKPPIDPRSSSQYWKQTQDWTENKEANKSLRHIVTGPASSIKVLRRLIAAGSSPVQLNPAPATLEVQKSPTLLSPIDLPIPPMAAFPSAHATPDQAAESECSPPAIQSLGRRRLSSTAGSVSSHNSDASDISFSPTDSDYSSQPTPPDYSHDVLQPNPQVSNMETHYDYSTEPQVFNPDDHIHSYSPHQVTEAYIDPTTASYDNFPSTSHGAVGMLHSSFPVYEEYLEAPQQIWEPYQTDCGSFPQRDTFHSAGRPEPFAENPSMIHPENPLQVHQGTVVQNPPLSTPTPYYTHSHSGTLAEGYPTHRYTEFVADQEQAPFYDFGPGYPAPQYIPFPCHP